MKALQTVLRIIALCFAILALLGCKFAFPLALISLCVLNIAYGIELYRQEKKGGAMLTFLCSVFIILSLCL